MSAAPHRAYQQWTHTQINGTNTHTHTPKIDDQQYVAVASITNRVVLQVIDIYGIIVTFAIDFYSIHAMLAQQVHWYTVHICDGKIQ